MYTTLFLNKLRLFFKFFIFIQFFKGYFPFQLLQNMGYIACNVRLFCFLSQSFFYFSILSLYHSPQLHDVVNVLSHLFQYMKGKKQLSIIKNKCAVNKDSPMNEAPRFYYIYFDYLNLKLFSNFYTTFQPVNNLQISRIFFLLT